MQLNELSAKISSQRKALLEICSKARNEYSRHQIRRDFRAGMKVSLCILLSLCNPLLADDKKGIQSVKI